MKFILNYTLLYLVILEEIYKINYFSDYSEQVYEFLFNKSSELILNSQDVFSLQPRWLSYYEK